MNVADLWPQAAVEFGILKNLVILRLFQRWERAAYSCADLVTAQTPHLVEHVRNISRTTDTIIFPNGVDALAVQRAERKLRHDLSLRDDTFVVGYAGTIGRSHALEQLVNAAKLMSSDPDITFICVGDGPRRAAVEAEARRSQLDRMLFLRPVPAVEMPSVLSSFDVGIVCQADLPLLEGARSSKMFEIFATETPIVFCGAGEGAEIARASGAALVVPPEDPEALASAIMRLRCMSESVRRSMGACGRAYVTAHFDRAAIAKDVESALVHLAENGSQRG